MYLFYLDASGNTRLNLAHAPVPFYFLMALAVPGERARALEDSVTRTLAARFGDRCRVPGFECKGSDLFRGEGPCAGIRPADRVALYAELVGRVEEHGARLLWEGIDKAALSTRQSGPTQQHAVAFLRLTEQIERFLRARGEYGLLVSDEEKEVEAQVVEDLPRYKEFGVSLGYHPLDLTRIVDNVHWMKSHDSRLLQLCDVCVYLCQRYHRDPGGTSLNAQTVRCLWTGLERNVESGKMWP
ncbi:MAG TPA: DUF3800 domain-containing protein [Longimicrobium sp.]|nr:DUF3800 domain-containing protein [Longimicrobium sp.]